MLDGAARSPVHEHCRFMNSDHDHGSGTPASVNAEPRKFGGFDNTRLLEELVSREWNSRRCVGFRVVAFGLPDSPGARPVKVTHARRAEKIDGDRQQCAITPRDRPSVTPRQRSLARRIPQDARPFGIAHRRHTQITHTNQHAHTLTIIRDG